MNELLQKIKDEYASKSGTWKNFEMLWDCTNPQQSDVDEVAERYADAVTAELKAENEKMKLDITELREALKTIKMVLPMGSKITIIVNKALDQTNHYENE